MGKRVDVTYELPADVETVYAALTSPDWPATRSRELKDDSRVESRTEQPGGAVTFTVSRGLPDGIPGFLEKFLPKGGRAQQTEAWAAADGGVRRGTWTGEIPGAPAKTGGTMSLEPLPSGGTRYRIEGEVKVSIPLVGGKAESFVADMIAKLSAREVELLRQGLPG